MEPFFYKNELMKHLRDFRVAMEQINDSDFTEQIRDVENWMDEVRIEEVKSDNLKHWIRNKADWQREKDREYAKFLYELIGETL